MIRVIETNNADDYDYDDFVVGDYVVDIDLGGGSKYHGVFSTYEDACDHIDKNLPNNNGDYDKYISKRNKPSKKKGLLKKFFKGESNKVRVAEAYRDYEDPRALERELQDWLADHPKDTWNESDYETYYDLKDRINFAWQDEEYDMDIYDESCLTEFYNASLHDKLKQDGYTYVGSQGGWYCYQKNNLGGGRPKYKAFPMDADDESAIEDVSYEQVKGKDPMPYDLDTMDYYGRGKRGGLSYRFAYESKLTESDFTGDPLLPDVRDVYDELVRMYDVRKDVGYVETAKKMAEYVGGKANVRAFRSKMFDTDRMEIDFIIKDGEFKYTGYSLIDSSREMATWYRYIEDLCMAFYKANGGKGGYTPDLIKAIGRG